MKFSIKNLLMFSIPVLVIFLLGFVFILNKESDTPGLSKKEIEIKVDKLLSEMTLEEKIGQMTQVDILALESFDDIEKYKLGSLLAGGNSEIDDISPEGWANYYDNVQSYALKTRLKIPLIFGIDAVHGHHNVNGAVIFPHHIALGATRNADLVEKAYRITAVEIAATGIDWDFAPCIAVARNEKWGRTYESFGETPELSEELGAAAVRGLQNGNLGDETAVLACAKHYVGDGGTTNGKDQGDTECDETSLRQIHLPAYIAAHNEGAGSIMISYSSFNGEKLHGHKYLLTDVLKKEIGYEGFLVSDWAAIDQLEGDYKSDIERSINAGLDMIMIPNGSDKENNYIEFITYLKELVEEGKVPMERIDDAVRRILKVKTAMNLFERPFTDRSLLKKVGSKEHREVARECVRQSLVLLKNENKVLPFSKEIKNLHVAGKGADDIGMQCGGWTIIWQGETGNIIDGGTTILSAIKNTVSETTKVTYSADASVPDDAEAVVIVVGETPYAEMVGDKEDLSLSAEDQKLIKKAKDSGKPVVVLLISGRPMLIEPSLNLSDAFVAIWQPGTEGQGVVDVLFGDYNPTGKLPHSWPRNMDQIPLNVGDPNYDPLFSYGYGLSY